MKLLIILFFTLFSHTLWAVTPDQIIAKADSIRNPSDSFAMEVEIDDGERISLFDVSLMGNDKTLIKTILPKRDKGRNMLMLDEQMWVYIPNLKRAVRISLGQKLTGQAANGDISRMRWSGDYSAKIISESKMSWKLHLKATKKGLTYDQLNVEVAKSNFHPLKAEYLTVTGKILKVATFQKYKKVLGKIRPTEIKIEDHASGSSVTYIRIKKMENKKFRSSLFNRRNLK